MGHMKDLLITIYNGGDEAVAAVQRMGKDWREQLEQAAAEIERRWIPVAERLPENGQQVLACVRLPHWTHEMPTLIETLDYDQGRFLNDDVDPRNYVTHWMPLPEPPAHGEATGKG